MGLTGVRGLSIEAAQKKVVSEDRVSDVETHDNERYKRRRHQRPPENIHHSMDQIRLGGHDQDGQGSGRGGGRGGRGSSSRGKSAVSRGGRAGGVAKHPI